MARRAVPDTEILNVVKTIRDLGLKTYKDMEGKISVSPRSIQEWKKGNTTIGQKFLVASKLLEQGLSDDEILQEISSIKKEKGTHETLSLKEAIAVYEYWQKLLKFASEKQDYTPKMTEVHSWATEAFMKKISYTDITDIINLRGKWSDLIQKHADMIRKEVEKNKEKKQEKENQKTKVEIYLQIEGISLFEEYVVVGVLKEHFVVFPNEIPFSLCEWELRKLEDDCFVKVKGLSEAQVHEFYMSESLCDSDNIKLKIGEQYFPVNIDLV